MPAAPQRDIVAVQFGGEPLMVGGRAQGVQPEGFQGAERLAVPQPDRLLEQVGGPFVLLRGAHPADQVPEAVQIHVQGVRGQRVAVGPAHDGRADAAVGEGGAEPGQVAVEGVTGAPRRVVAPHPVDELVDRERAVDLHQQGGQHTPLPGVPEVEGPTADDRLDAAQQPELHRLVPSRSHPPRQACTALSA